jgi:tRNA 2-thiouridine synthesizing protein A
LAVLVLFTLDNYDVKYSQIKGSERMQQSDAQIPEQIQSYIEGEYIFVDARRLRCPLPVLKLARAHKQSPHVTRFLLCATDDAARIDIPAFCVERKFELTAMHTLEACYWFLISVG